MVKQHWWLPLLLATTAAVAQTGTGPRKDSTQTTDGVQISAPVRNGRIVVTEGWMVDAETGQDVLRGSVAYKPGVHAEGAACHSIRFVQVARVERAKDSDYDWRDGETNRNLMRTSANLAEGVKKGYFVDHDAFKCTPGEQCSPYFRDYWPNAEESQDGFLRGRSITQASLVDYPYGWENFESIALESCARCDDGQFLACVEWGGRWPGSGDRSLSPIRIQINPRRPSSMRFVASTASIRSQPKALGLPTRNRALWLGTES